MNREQRQALKERVARDRAATVTQAVKTAAKPQDAEPKRDMVIYACGHAAPNKPCGKCRQAKEKPQSEQRKAEKEANRAKAEARAARAKVLFEYRLPHGTEIHGKYDGEAKQWTIIMAVPGFEVLSGTRSGQWRLLRELTDQHRQREKR